MVVRSLSAIERYGESKMNQWTQNAFLKFEICYGKNQLQSCLQHNTEQGIEYPYDYDQFDCEEEVMEFIANGYQNMKDKILGKMVSVTVDQPLGSHHPKHPDMIYPVNYGYVKGVIAGDGEEQDAYILGVDKPVSLMRGKVIAIIHRLNDDEDKWVVVPDHVELSLKEIEDSVSFQEQYFEYLIQTLRKS